MATSESLELLMAFMRLSRNLTLFLMEASVEVFCRWSLVSLEAFIMESGKRISSIIMQGQKWTFLEDDAHHESKRSNNCSVELLTRVPDWHSLTNSTG